jgi:hypothetical protein
VDHNPRLSKIKEMLRIGAVINGIRLGEEGSKINSSLLSTNSSVTTAAKTDTYKGTVTSQGSNSSSSSSPSSSSPNSNNNNNKGLGQLGASTAMSGGTELNSALNAKTWLNRGERPDPSSSLLDLVKGAPGTSGMLPRIITWEEEDSKQVGEHLADLANVATKWLMELIAGSTTQEGRIITININNLRIDPREEEAGMDREAVHSMLKDRDLTNRMFPNKTIILVGETKGIRIDKHVRGAARNKEEVLAALPFIGYNAIRDMYHHKRRYNLLHHLLPNFKSETVENINQLIRINYVEVESGVHEFSGPDSQTIKQTNFYPGEATTPQTTPPKPRDESQADTPADLPLPEKGGAREGRPHTTSIKTAKQYEEELTRTEAEIWSELQSAKDTGVRWGDELDDEEFDDDEEEPISYLEKPVHIDLPSEPPKTMLVAKVEPVKRYRYCIRVYRNEDGTHKFLTNEELEELNDPRTYTNMNALKLIKEKFSHRPDRDTPFWIGMRNAIQDQWDEAYRAQMAGERKDIVNPAHAKWAMEHARIQSINLDRDQRYEEARTIMENRIKAYERRKEKREERKNKIPIPETRQPPKMVEVTYDPKVMEQDLELPPIIREMLENENREIRQLAYRFATTPPTKDGRRTVNIWLGVRDNGQPQSHISAMSQYEKQRRFNDPEYSREHKQQLRCSHRIGEMEHLFSINKMRHVGQFANFYLSEINKIKEKHNEISNVGITPIKWNDPLLNLPKESEEGPHEYKAYPFFTDVEYKENYNHIILRNGEKVEYLPKDLETYKKINTNIVPAGHYWTKQTADKKRERLKAHGFGDESAFVPVTCIRLTIVLNLPGWKLVPQVAYIGRDKSPLTALPGPRPRFFYTRKTVEEGVYSTLMKPSRFERCYRMSELLDKTKEEREHIMDRQAAHRDLMFAMEGTIDSLVTACCVSRQVQGVANSLEMMKQKKGIRTFDTTKNNERHQLKIIKQLIEYVIKLYNQTDFTNTRQIYNTHDNIIQLAKEASAQLRVVWQKAQVTHSQEEKVQIIKIMLKSVEITERETPLNDIAKILLDFLSYTNPEFLDDVTIVKMGRDELTLPTYGLCCMGFINRSLPRPSSGKLAEEEMNTYNRFKTPKEKHPWDDRLKNDTREWAKEFFKDVPAEVKKSGRPFLPHIGASASWERPRSKGGFASLLHDLHSLIKGLTSEQVRNIKLEKVAEWKEKYDHLASIPLQPGNLSIKSEIVARFATAFGEDLLKPYLEHARNCKREECEEKEYHLPMYTIGIKELGGKSRVPCITTGFLNMIAEPIRQKMFIAIKADERCSFRLKNVNKEHLLRSFLKYMEETDFVHSGDMTVSTDNFPMWFMKAVGLGMYDAGVINQHELDILLLCTGPFKMIEPNEKNDKIRTSRRLLTTINELRKIEQIRPQYTNDEMKKMERMLLHNRMKIQAPLSTKGVDASKIDMLNNKPKAIEKREKTPYTEFYKNKEIKNEMEMFKQRKVKPLEKPILTPQEKWGLRIFPQSKLVANRNYYSEQNNGTVPGFDGWYDGFWTPSTKTWVPNKRVNGILTATTCKRCGQSIITTHEPKDCNNEALRLYTRITEIKLIHYPNRNYVKTKDPVLAGFVKPEGAYRLDEGPPGQEDYPNLFTLPYNETDMYSSKKGRYVYGNWPDETEEDPEKLLGLLVTNILHSWDTPEDIYDGVYLTKKGVQMSTAISVGMLYSYNLFSDSYARKLFPNCKGKSQLAGDDSLRFGDIDYITGYRQAIEALGGKWSKTKDVVGKYPRGVFTELLFEDGKIIKVPKIKTIVRPEEHDNNNQAASFKRAIPAVQSLTAPEEAKAPLVREILERFPELQSPQLPLGLPKELGGLGKFGPRMDPTTQSIWDNIKRIRDPIKAVEALRIFRSSISIEIEPEGRGLLSITEICKNNPPTFMRGPRELRDAAYRRREVAYLHLETQRLRGLIESASILDHPPKPVRFKQDHGQLAEKYVGSMEKLYTFLQSEQLDDYNVDFGKPGLRDQIPSDNTYLSQTYLADVSTTWVEKMSESPIGGHE